MKKLVLFLPLKYFQFCVWADTWMYAYICTAYIVNDMERFKACRVMVELARVCFSIDVTVYRFISKHYHSEHKHYSINPVYTSLAAGK